MLPTLRARVRPTWPLGGPWAALVGLVGLDVASGQQLSGVYAGAAVLASVRSGARRTAGFAALATAAATASGWWNDNLGSSGWFLRLSACAGIGLVAVLSARVHERQQERLARTTLMAQRVLDALAVELTGARTVKEAADGFVGHGVRSLGALSAMVVRLDEDDVLRTVTWHGRGQLGDASSYEEFPLDADIPGAKAVRERTDLHYRGLAEIHRAFPQLVGYYPSERSMHLLPLLAGDRAIGLLALTFPPESFGPEEDAFLHSLAGALTSAILRARELQAADAAAQRTAILAEASMTLSRSLDPDEVDAEVARLLVPRFADWCSLQVLEGDQLVTRAVHHVDPETTAWARTITGEFPTRMDAPTGAPNVIRTGRSEHYPYIPVELVEAGAQSPEHLAILRRLGFTSAIVAPLRGRDGVFGALTLIHAESGRRYDEADVAFLEELADRVALALETASTFEQQSERLAGVMQVAQAAQAAILAPPPERIGPVELAARYVSAAAEAQIGGDLYEVLPGPSSGVRVMVGDVRGKGLAAVRTATVVLGAFRAAAAVHDDLAAVAVEVDRRIQPFFHDGEEFVTGVLVDIAADGAFTVVSCGHPEPVLLRPDGAVATVLVQPDPPLGLGVAPVATTGRLAPGERLLLFTDGLIEARGRDGGFVDPACLLPAVARAPMASALDELLDSFTAAVGHVLGDDLALLLVGYEPDAG